MGVLGSSSCRHRYDQCTHSQMFVLTRRPGGNLVVPHSGLGAGRCGGGQLLLVQRPPHEDDDPRHSHQSGGLIRPLNSGLTRGLSGGLSGDHHRDNRRGNLLRGLSGQTRNQSRTREVVSCNSGGGGHSL